MPAAISKALSRGATALVAAACFAAHAQPSDDDFAAARDAFRAGDSARLERIAPRLKGHVLEAYVDYWRLRLKLDDVDPDSVRGFLRQYADTPLAGRLRGEWLKALGKRGAWDLFGEEFRGSGDDAELICYAAQLKLVREGAAADVSEARRLWFSGHEQPESCQPVFSALLAQRALGVSDVWVRFRLAHEAGNFRLAARIAAELPLVERPPTRELQRIDRSARAVLAKGDFRWSSVTGRELALYALDRVAQVDATAAHEAWSRWGAKLPRADRTYGSLLIAYHGATQLLPEARDWYREAEDAPQTESQRAWRVRAALRIGAWSDVARAIDSMPAAEALDPAWRYWKARALAAAGEDEDATRLYGGLATEPSFYGLLAAEALGARVAPMSEPLTPKPPELAAFAAQPAVQRVLKLSALDLRPEAQREWIEVVRGLSDDGLLLAASFAQSNGLNDRSINTAERTRLRHDFALRYPTPFLPEIEAAARDNDLDSALVYGLVRQESRFVADIVSASGAVGLMQLMPATARWVAGRIGTDSRSLGLRDPAGNARLGAYYLRYVLDKLGGMPLLAAAAYNAGPKRAEAWRAAVPLEGAVYAETIPFTETRDYVKKVLANAMFYQWRLGLRYVALKDRLGVVPPRGAEWDSTPDSGAAASAAIAGSDHQP
ncbi:MAG TPA: transglycosylase SLT domain-containing protein [Casimicrobiaceae bacterium]|nr:transglycosylase SLT domain-containing protein [Casimicrobiaceae bacterium]